MATQHDKRYRPQRKNAVILNRWNVRIERFLAHKKNRLLIAGVVSLVFLIVLSCADVKAGLVDDDWGMSIALSGRYPVNGLCLFINAALCRLIVFFNTAIPYFNWFFVFEQITVYVSFFFFIYAMLTYAPPLIAFIIIAALEIVILPDATYHSNFTFVAFLAAATGGILLFANAGESRRSPLAPIAGTVLFTLGFLWRPEAALLALPFFSVLFLGIIVNIWKSTRLATTWIASFFKEVGLRFFPCMITAIACIGFSLYNSYEWQQPGWSEWANYNQARAALSDYPLPEYAEAEHQLTELGISENDYYLATHWITADPDVFDQETLEAIASIRPTVPLTDVVFSGLTGFPASVGLHSHAIIVFLIIAILSFVAGSKRERIFILALAVIAFLVSSYFYGLGRLIPRVENPLWFYAASATALTHFCIASRQTPGCLANLKRNTRVYGKYGTVLGCGIGIALTLMLLVKLVPSFNPALPFIDQRDYRPDNEMVSYITSNSENIYVWDTSSFYAIEESYGLKNLPAKEFLQRYFSLGGWLTGSPLTDANNQQAGIPNLIRGLAENDNAYLVVTHLSSPNQILLFIQEHYYPDASMSKVDTLPGYEIWQYSANE